MFQNNLKKIVAALSFLLLTQNATAGLFTITPNIGYKNHTMKLTNLSDIETDVKMSDPVYGLKLGVQAMAGVSIDIAGAYSAGKAKLTTAAVESENDYTHTVAAAQLSVGAMNTFKLYLGYIPMNEFAFKKTNSSVETKFKGIGYQAGLAFNLTQSIAIGVQYDINQFTEINLEPIGKYEDFKTYYKKIDSQSTSVNLFLSF